MQVRVKSHCGEHYCNGTGCYYLSAVNLILEIIFAAILRVWLSCELMLSFALQVSKSLKRGYLIAWATFIAEHEKGNCSQNL